MWRKRETAGSLNLKCFLLCNRNILHQGWLNWKSKKIFLLTTGGWVFHYCYVNQLQTFNIIKWFAVQCHSSSASRLICESSGKSLAVVPPWQSHFSSLFPGRWQLRHQNLAPRRLLFWKTNKPGAQGLTHDFKPTAWPAHHACAHLYHLGMGWVTMDSCFGMA